MSDLIQRAREALVDVTPGPWKAVAAGQADDLNEVVRPDPFQSIADVEGSDARFIAAARDLVPAMADRIAAQEALLREAMAALDERDGGTHDEDCKVFRPFINLCNCGHERTRATLAKLRAHLEDKL